MAGLHRTPSPKPPRIVVGYDGSAEARLALEDAAHRAGPSGEVFIVICFDEPPDRLGRPNADRALREAQTVARKLLHDLEDGEVPALQLTRWETELLPGPAGKAIADVARVRDADEIAIGSRGVGRTRALLGSVSQDVLRRADRPVRVVTGKAAERRAAEPLPVP